VLVGFVFDHTVSHEPDRQKSRDDQSKRGYDDSEKIFLFVKTMLCHISTDLSSLQHSGYKLRYHWNKEERSVSDSHKKNDGYNDRENVGSLG